MTPTPSRTPAGEILTTMTMEIFRVSSLILNVGDRLAAHLGLTGARWQILGAIVRAGPPQTVAGLARNLGTNRQNVQRIVNDLHRLKFLTFGDNPRHRRAQLVLLTAKGKRAYGAAMELQAPWVNQVTDGLDLKDLEGFQRVLLALRQRLSMGAGKSGDPGPAFPGRGKA
jgi:DNA-binding MarR family transcriptional regulator